MRPVGHTLDQPVFHWVPVDVIYAPDEIVLIAHRMFPETPLPNSSLTRAQTRRRTHALSSTMREVKIRECLLDLLPAQGEIVVSLGESPDGVEVVGKDNERHNVKGTFLLH